MLHITYRPKTFADIIGNETTIKSLKSLFRKSKLKSHVFLFHGQYGSGKTTFAHVLKNELNCSEHDFTEINNANSRGIDTAREIIKNIHYAPIEGDVKVILLDEVHMATKEMQNALLKVLEDGCPPHVYFILCTTEPKKLLPTIRSRCLTYQVDLLSDKNMGKLLDFVCKKEKITVKKKVSSKIIDKAEGCPRDALQLLEQIIYLSSKDQLKAIKIFKTQEQKIMNLCNALLNKTTTWNTIKNILINIDDEPETVRRSILGIINAIMLRNENTRCAIIFQAFKDHFYDTGKSGLTFACHRVISF